MNPLKGKRFEDFILYETDDLILINKPPFISTLEDRNSPINILKLAKEYCNEASVCHRLDKDTSGILVIAKHEQFYKYFSAQLENREVTKMYHALVDGQIDWEEHELDGPIYSSSSKSRVDFYQGKPSLTLVSTLHIYKRHSLLACMPFTGRLHQIRVHLSNAGAPIAGDGTYGGKVVLLSQIKKNYRPNRQGEERPLIQRMALHAAGIAFDLPNGEKVKINAPYPKDFDVLLKQIEKNNS